MMHKIYSNFMPGEWAKPNLEIDEFELAPPPLPPGAAVLIDLKSGEILALASKPNYDLSKLTPFIPQSVYDQDRRLPRAWHPGYAPASPFKLISAIAGYKAGQLDANQRKHVTEFIEEWNAMFSRESMVR